MYWQGLEYFAVEQPHLNSMRIFKKLKNFAGFLATVSELFIDARLFMAQYYHRLLSQLLVQSHHRFHLPSY